MPIRTCPSSSWSSSLEPPRNLAHAPLFQVMFVLQNTAQQALVSAGAGHHPARGREPHRQVRPDPVDLRDRWRIKASLEYATDLFDRATIERMGGHFVQLLRSALADPDRPIGALDLVPAAERQRLVVEWNATGAPVPDDGSIVALFAAAVASCRDAVAVRETGRTMTFAELDARSDRVAARLEALVAGPEPVVGLAGDRSAALIAGVFGVLKAGAVFLPLDPAYPDDRLRFMIADSGVTVLLADAPARARLAPLLDGKPIRLLALEADLPQPPAGWQAARPRPQQRPI